MTKRRQFLLASLCAAMVLPVVWGAAHEAAAAPSLKGWMAQFKRNTSARPAPDTPFARENGDVVTLQAFKGKVVLVNFWATWCAPCIREMPSLDRLAAALGDEDFLVAAISIDRGAAEAARPFLDKLGVNKLQLFLDPKMVLAVKLGVRGMPTTFLLDRQGRVAGSLAGIAEWDSPEAEALVRSYLKEP